MVEREIEIEPVVPTCKLIINYNQAEYNTLCEEHKKLWEMLLAQEKPRGLHCGMGTRIIDKQDGRIYYSISNETTLAWLLNRLHCMKGFTPSLCWDFIY